MSKTKFEKTTISQGPIVLELPSHFSNFTGDVENPTDGGLFYNQRGEVFVRMKAIVKAEKLRPLCSERTVDILPQEITSGMPNGCKEIVVQSEPDRTINNKNDFLELLEKSESITKDAVQNYPEIEGVTVFVER